jgi:gluconolactonase
VILCDDLALPEGPLALADGSWLVTELALARGCVTEVMPDGARRVIAHTGRPNGLARTRDGVIWVAESLTPSIVRLAMDGTTETVLTRVGDTPLLWPNDICVGPDGALYMTDSGILVHDFLVNEAPTANFASLTYDGKIVRYDPVTGDAAILDAGYKFANGIAFGADGHLYTNETFTGEVYRYRVHGGVVSTDRERFGSVLDPAWEGAGFRGPDGMAFATDGRLFCTVFGQGDVTILNTDGSWASRIPLAGNSPTNVAFAPGERRIYVTEDQLGQLTVHDVDADGLALHE